MNITLNSVGKRFNSEWIFRQLSYNFETGKRYAITGPNGSGKSTLLQIIGGFLHHNEGTVEYSENNRPIPAEKIFSHISMAAPYLKVIEEMTLAEFLKFHQHTKGLDTRISIREIAASVSLKNVLHKQIRYYSSGMKQRVNLAQAIFSNTPIILLDEPLTNLDKEGNDMYERLIGQYTSGKTIIVSSNDKREYAFCTGVINITVYKENDNS